MPSFSSSDIEEARRRVQDMQNKARNFTHDDMSDKQQPHSGEHSGYKAAEEAIKPDTDDKSSLVILALILLLSNEEADNLLILALLYLLF